MKLRIIFVALFYNSLLLASAAAEKAKVEAPKAIADVPAAGAASASVAQLLTACTTASSTSVIAASAAKKGPLFFYKRSSTNNAEGTTYTSTLRLQNSKSEVQVSVEVVHKKNLPQPQATVKVVGGKVASHLIPKLLSCDQRFIRNTLIKKQPSALVHLFEPFEAECTLTEEYSASAATPAKIFCYTRSLSKSVFDERLVSSSKLRDKATGGTVCSVTLFDLETPKQNLLDDSHIEGNALYMEKQLLQVDSSMVIKILSDKMPTALEFLSADYEEMF